MASRPSLITPDEPILKTGIEYELGKYINDVRVDRDCVVKAIIPKYGTYGVDKPPVTTLLVEYDEYDENLGRSYSYIDVIFVDAYRSSHGFFGYTLTNTDEFNGLYYNSPISKDTILAVAPSYGREGSYNYGVNANVAFMSHPAVADDGIVISESFAERTKMISITKRVINITKDNIPINLYGDDNVFKFIPNVGEKVRPDGLLCGIRQRNDWFSVSDLSDENLRTFDSVFDTGCYVNTNSTVIDVTVTRGNYLKSEFTEKMTGQLDQYAEMLVTYYRNIVTQYENLITEKRRLHGGDDMPVRLTPRMHRFITDCMIKVNVVNNPRNKLCYRKLPIDQYRVEITTMSILKPDLGYKLTGIHGDKAVICRVLPDKDMPVDELGNRADVIADDTSTNSRMNPGRVYQHYMGALSRDNHHRLQSVLFGKYGNITTGEQLEKVDVDSTIQYLRGLYSHINSEMVTFIDSLNEEERANHVCDCVVNGINFYYPPDNENIFVDVISGLEQSEYKPHLGKIVYTNEAGVSVKSRDDIRIGRTYMMVLEKIANDYSSVSSARVNSFNFPIKTSNLDKYKYPHSLTPTKTLGETEVRILESFADPVTVAELMDLSLNPISHKLLVKGIIESDKAYDPDFNIDRADLDYGQTRSLMLMKHIFNAYGFDFGFEEEGINRDH